MNQQLRHNGIPSKFTALELLEEGLDKKLENILNFVVFPLGGMLLVALAASICF